MGPPPVEIFTEMVHQLVKLNARLVPPYGYGATLYIRPLLIGTSPEVGVRPSQEYLLLMLRFRWVLISRRDSNLWI
jgi:branched-chain amino acid aminotransferase